MNRRCDLRNAFTLIETIIAMSLLSLLMAIVWTMFSIYTKVEEKGVARAQEAGLLRAISRQIRHDLLHVVGIDKRRGVSISGKSDPTENQFPANGYLVGTPTDMHFLVCHDPGTLGAVDVMRVISYQPGSAVELDSDQQGRTESVSEWTEQPGSAFTNEFETPFGIDRHERSWIDYWEDRTLDDSSEGLLSTNRPIALQADDFVQVGKQSFADDSADQRSIDAQNVTDEIPELARLSLRYFDGDSWTSHWDSRTKSRLPLAIEVGFDLEAVKAVDPGTDRDAVVPIDAQQKALTSSVGKSKSLAAADAGTITVGEPDEIEDASLTEYRFIVSIPAAATPETRDDDADQTGQSEDAEPATESML